MHQHNVLKPKNVVKIYAGTIECFIGRSEPQEKFNFYTYVTAFDTTLFTQSVQCTSILIEKCFYFSSILFTNLWFVYHHT